MAEREYWSYSEYTILQFIPTDRYQAVYVVENEANELEWMICDIEGIAVARVETVQCSCAYRDEYRNPVDWQEEGREVDHDIVGVLLDVCGFGVCNATSNFSGLIRRGELPGGDEERGIYALDMGRFNPTAIKLPASHWK